MKRMRIAVLSILVLILAVSACAAPTPQAVERQMPVEKVVAAAAEPKAADASYGREEAANYASSQGAPLDVVLTSDRLIIRTGNLSLTVGDPEKMVTTIQDMVVGMGGYVVNSNAWRSNDHTWASMSVRVPAASFDAAMTQIKAIAIIVERDTTSGEDVTEEYVDLKAQLTNLQATETELRALLTEVRERTGKAEDIMSVYRELTNVRGQIEQIQGRMQYLERMVSMATINIDLQPDVAQEPISQSVWRPNATANSALQRLVGGLQWLADAVIWLILYVLPIALVVLLPLAIFLFLLGRWVRRKKSAA